MVPYKQGTPCNDVLCLQGSWPKDSSAKCVSCNVTPSWPIRYDRGTHAEQLDPSAGRKVISPFSARERSLHYTHTHIYVSICISLSLYIYIYIIVMYIFMYIYIYIYMYVYIDVQI